MPRHHQREIHSSRSKGARPWSHGSIAAVLFAAFGVAAAHAEVCDKVISETWQPNDGPIWLLNPNGFPIAWLLLASGFVLVIAGQSRWLGYLAAAVTLAFVALLVWDLLAVEQIYSFAFKEGCLSRATMTADLAIYSMASFAYAWFGYRAGRHPIPATS